MKAWLIYNIIFISGVQHSDSKFYVLHSTYLFFHFFGCAGSLLLQAGFSLVAASRGYCLVKVCRLLITVAALVVEYGFQVGRLSS